MAHQKIPFEQERSLRKNRFFTLDDLDEAELEKKLKVTWKRRSRKEMEKMPKQTQEKENYRLNSSVNRMDLPNHETFYGRNSEEVSGKK